MRVFKLAAGLAIGYVLGSRAGRDKYEQIVAATRKAQEHPTVVQVQQKAREFLGTASASAASHSETAATATLAVAGDQLKPDTAPTVASPASAGRASRRNPSGARKTSASTAEPSM